MYTYMCIHTCMYIYIYIYTHTYNIPKSLYEMVKIHGSNGLVIGSSSSPGLHPGSKMWMRLSDLAILGKFHSKGGPP